MRLSTRIALLLGLVFSTLLAPQAPRANAAQTSDVAIFTDENGKPAYDACYVLVGYSEEGCDENRDGRVMFASIPWGTYTVRQTADLGPERSVDDFTIEVRGNINEAGFQGFSATIINTTGASAPPSGAVNIALITRDPRDGHLLTGTCYVLVDYSNEGCDENGDGQVTFAAIPFGTYTVRQTQTPAGYPTINDYDILVQPTGYMEGPSFGVPLGFIVKQAPDQNAPDARNVSVILIDMYTHEKVSAAVCVELVGASNVGCDDDLPDGQIDFLDVPAGGPYELRFTNLPSGYEVATVGGPLAVRVDAGPGAPANQMVFVLLVDQDENEGIEPSETAAVVGEDGFTLTLDGITVSGAADVAPVGTAIRAQPIQEDLPDEIDDFAESVGVGVDVILGDGIQPATPLTITFAPDMVGDWSAAADSSGDLIPVVFTTKADGPGMELADAQLLPDGSVVVTADHLSKVQPALASRRGFAQWFGDQVLIFLDVRSNRPECVDRRADDLDWKFSAIPNDLVWACADKTARGLSVSLQNNSPEVWFVTTNPGIEGIPSTLSLTGFIVSTLSRVGMDWSTTAPLVPPDGTIDYRMADQPGPIMFDVAINEPLTVANAFASVLLAVLPTKALEAFGRGECFLDIVSTSLDMSSQENEMEDPQLGGLASTVIGCFAQAIGGLRGGLIGVALATPGALTTMVDGFERELSGRDEFSFTLSKVGDVSAGPVETASSANAWPSDRDDGPPALYVWLGANMYGYPDWVACDAAATYCLVGYSGGEHLLVQMSGLVVIGTVADSAANPRQELLALGLSDEIVAQILGQ